MIKHRDQLLLGKTTVFTRIAVETPLEDDLGLPADACYLYIQEGEGQTLYAPAQITASKGTVILSTCGLTIGNLIAHEMAGSMETIIVHFNRDLLQLIFEGEKPAIWKELQRPVNQYLVQEAASQLVKLYFNNINELFDNQAAVTEELLKLKLKEIVLLLLQTENAEPVKEIMRSLFSDRIFDFEEIVEAHLLTPATVTNLAQLTNSSLSTFKRRFKEVYHQSPGQYLLEKRLEKIAEELRMSDEAISSIGYRLGFDSPEHLSRSFKKKFGVSPSSYRMTSMVK